MRKAAWLVVLVLLLSSTAVFAADTLKIGYVDLIRALNESEAGKKAKTDLEFLIKAKQGPLDEKGKAIEKGKNDLEKQSTVLSPEARKAKEEEVEKLIREYQRLVADSQTEVKKKEADLTGDIIKGIRAVIQKIGQDEGYTLILEGSEGQILYAAKEGDLTDSVIKKYNDSAKAKR